MMVGGVSVSPDFLWITAGLILVVLETFAPGAFLVWIGVAALGTGLLTLWLGFAFAWQAVVFGGLAAVAIAVGLKLRRPPKPSMVNMPNSGLVGRAATALTFDGREGRVRLGDSDWPARLVPSAGLPVAPGARLNVAGIQGMVLLVEPLIEDPRPAPAAAGYESETGR